MATIVTHRSSTMMIILSALVTFLIMFVFWENVDVVSDKKVKYVGEQDLKNSNKGAHIGKSGVIPARRTLFNEPVNGCQSRYGKPILGKDITLVYNRVPKCGSRTLLSLATTLGPKNGFRRPRPILRSVRPTDQYENVTLKIISSQPPNFLEGHVYFVDITNGTKPVFINLVRDPLDRIVSQYYFSRFGDDKFTDIQRLHSITKPQFIDETFDECVLRNRSTCIGDAPLTQQLRHFCGYHPRCRVPSKWAADEAKRNIDKFLLVGVTEQYGNTIQVLEHLLPHFLKGLVAEYHKPKTDNMTTLTKSKNKHAPSVTVQKIMKEKLKYEYQVYNYAVNKFNQLRRNIYG